jgi:hypothetical protein
MHSAKSLLPFAIFIVVIALLAGGGVWWYANRQALPKGNVAVAHQNTADEIDKEDAKNEANDSADSQTPQVAGPIELSPDVAKTRPEQLQACQKAKDFIGRCLDQNVPLNGTHWSRIHGYGMPLPPLPAPHGNFTLEPNPVVCGVAQEWHTYCVANIFERG